MACKAGTQAFSSITGGPHIKQMPVSLAGKRDTFAIAVFTKPTCPFHSGTKFLAADGLTFFSSSDGALSTVRLSQAQHEAIRMLCSQSFKDVSGKNVIRCPVGKEEAHFGELLPELGSMA